MEDKFGEHRPEPGDLGKDEFGNDKRLPMDLMPMKIERDCKCLGHVTMRYSVEMDVPQVNNPFELIMLMQKGETIPTAKQWVSVSRIQFGYN